MLTSILNKYVYITVLNGPSNDDIAPEDGLRAETCRANANNVITRNSHLKEKIYDQLVIQCDGSRCKTLKKSINQYRYMENNSECCISALCFKFGIPKCFLLFVSLRDM
jgi:hypothetical protein